MTSESRKVPAIMPIAISIGGRTRAPKEWVQYDFAKLTKVSGVDVYWFDDTGVGECRLPKSWQLSYREKW